MKRRLTGEMFPSPLGVSYFQIKEGNNLRRNMTVVSVPSRGILFPNMRNNQWYRLREVKVSVPSRGILFPNKVYFSYRKYG